MISPIGSQPQAGGEGNGEAYFRSFEEELIAAQPLVADGTMDVAFDIYMYLGQMPA